MRREHHREIARELAAVPFTCVCCYDLACSAKAVLKTHCLTGPGDKLVKARIAKFCCQFYLNREKCLGIIGVYLRNQGKPVRFASQIGKNSQMSQCWILSGSGAGNLKLLLLARFKIWRHFSAWKTARIFRDFFPVVCLICEKVGKVVEYSASEPKNPCEFWFMNQKVCERRGNGRDSLMLMIIVVQVSWGDLLKRYLGGLDGNYFWFDSRRRFDSCVIWGILLEATRFLGVLVKNSGQLFAGGQSKGGKVWKFWMDRGFVRMHVNDLNKNSKSLVQEEGVNRPRVFKLLTCLTWPLQGQRSREKMSHEKRGIPELRVVNEAAEDDADSVCSTSTVQSPLTMKPPPLLCVPTGGGPRRRHSWVYGWARILKISRGFSNSFL